MTGPTRGTLRQLLLAAGCVAPACTTAAPPGTDPRCLLVSSYHQGYTWSDGIERGVRSVLEGECELRRFDMDTKRNEDEAHKQRIAREVKDLVDSWQPDVVIAADDEAAKYVVEVYFKNADVPFVFCGVNWTAETYGFPYTNVTGIVEVAPIRPMLETAVNLAGGTRATYIGADTPAESKSLERFEAAAAELGVEVDHVFVDSTDGWIEAFRQAQSQDFLVLGSNAGVDDWDAARVATSVATHSRRLTVTNHAWMMPYAMLGMTKVPEEHGEWSASAALAIIEGVPPSDIPMVSNRRWDLWTNDVLLVAAGLELPDHLSSKAKPAR